MRSRVYAQTPSSRCRLYLAESYLISTRALITIRFYVILSKIPVLIREFERALHVRTSTSSSLGGFTSTISKVSPTLTLGTVRSFDL